MGLIQRRGRSEGIEGSWNRVKGEFTLFGQRNLNGNEQEERADPERLCSKKELTLTRLEVRMSCRERKTNFA